MGGSDFEIAEILSDLSVSIAGEEGFFADVLAEGDWSGIIRLHAFVEAAVTQAIIAALSEPRLVPIIKRLPLHGDGPSKIGIARALGILQGKEERRFLRTLSELRNELVHDLAGLSFQFSEYVDGMSSAERTRWIDTVCHWAPNHGVGPSWRDAALTRPLAVLLLNVADITARLNLSRVRAEAEQQSVEEKLRLLEDLLAPRDDGGQTGAEPMPGSGA